MLRGKITRKGVCKLRSSKEIAIIILPCLFVDDLTCLCYHPQFADEKNKKQDNWLADFIQWVTVAKEGFQNLEAHSFVLIIFQTQKK